MEPLGVRIVAHLEKTEALAKQAEALLPGQALNRLRLDYELARLRCLEEAVRNMAKYDPAVREMLERLDAMA